MLGPISNVYDDLKQKLSNYNQQQQQQQQQQLLLLLLLLQQSNLYMCMLKKSIFKKQEIIFQVN